MSDSICVQLLPHSEKLAISNPFPIKATGANLLYHQWRTYYALQDHSLVVNTYNTGTGKTRAALLRLFDPESRGKNMLFIAPTNELIAQHAKDIKKFLQDADLDYHVIPVDAKELRALPTQHDFERVGEKLNRLLQNPREYGFEGQKPLVIVTNPDIFYYALYFSAYNPHDRRNLFEQFVLRFDYVVIDEFHYYAPKQLAMFLFYFVLCREWGYFKDGRKICLLSATPEPEVIEYLNRIFDSSELALISPANEPSDSASLATTRALAPLTLEIQRTPLDEYINLSETQMQLRDWVVNQQLDGALISSALWRINLAHQALKSSLGAKMARITGAEKTQQRRNAPLFPLVLATPTVDIGYNFDKPNKTRQPVDFVIFDARTRDQFLQRLGRTGRVLGRSQFDAPSYAVGLVNVNDDGWSALKALDGQTLDRHSFAESIQNTIPPRRDLYSYMQSYGMLELFRPLFNLKRMLRPDLHEWLEKLFEGVRNIFAPDNSRWHFGSIEGVMRRFEKLEKIVRHDEDKWLGDFLQEYIDWHKQTATSEQFSDLQKKLATSPHIRQQIRNWAEEQYWQVESLFSFRESLETPTACVFDPKHLLADSDITLYDALHVATNYEVDWFLDEQDFSNKTGQIPEKAVVYAQIRGHRSARLRFVFEYAAPDRMTRDRFEEIYCRRPVMLKGLRLRAELPNGNGTFPLNVRIRRAFEDIFVPTFVVQDKTLASAQMYLHLRDTNIFPRLFKVSFPDGTESDYLAIIGNAAFVVDAELQKIFWALERKEDHKPIIT